MNNHNIIRTGYDSYGCSKCGLNVLDNYTDYLTTKCEFSDSSIPLVKKAIKA